ncbi:unnamed protein product [Prunus armeniaca]
MGPILRWGYAKKQQLGLLRMKVAFALAEPRLDWGAVMGDHWLVRLCMLNILASLGIAECGVKKRRQGLIGEGANGASRGKWDSEVDSHRRCQTVDALFGT